MPVQIRLDHSKQLDVLRYYVPGQIITGRVIYDSESGQEDLQSVSIHFEGYGSIKPDIMPTALFFIGTGVSLVQAYAANSHDSLFHQERHLLQRPVTITQQTLTWPFEFLFPKSDEKNGRSLAPSFSQYFEKRIGHNGALSASVRYQLRAVVQYSSRRRLQASTCVQVAFRTLADGPVPKPQLQRCNLTPPNTHSLKQKLHLFGNKASSVTFETTMSLPTALAPNTTEALSLSIQTTPGNRQRIIILQGVLLTLQSFTTSIWTAQATRSIGTFSLRNLNTPSSSRVPDIMLSSALGLESFHPDPALTPDFITSIPYINHAHRCKVQAWVRDEQSGQEFELEGMCPMSVLPPQREHVNNASEAAADSPRMYGK
ncbi:MAG: hypothetical protein Q9165_008211 [Trypethelium subeluteriae]